MRIPNPIRRLNLAAFLLTSALPALAHAGVDHVVLVHGMSMEGSTWRQVFDRLAADGQNVWVAQLPHTSPEADIAAIRRLLDGLDGSILLVGHSYGGMVITEAGIDPDVVGLVYVAAFQPDRGETMAALSSKIPAELPRDGVAVTNDGYFTIRPETFTDVVASELPVKEAHYLSQSQKPASGEIMAYATKDVAWSSKPVWSIIATQDRVIAPAMQEEMSARTGGIVSRIEGGHLLPLSQPDAVASVIESAVRNLK